MKKPLCIALAMQCAIPVALAGNPILPEICRTYSEGPSGTRYPGRTYTGYNARKDAQDSIRQFNELEEWRRQREGSNYRRVTMGLECHIDMEPRIREPNPRR